MDAADSERLWPVFCDEALAHLAAIGEGLLKLEQVEGPERVAILGAVRREAHSLKGSASSLGLSELERKVHVVEDLLARSSEDGRLEAELVQRALEAIEDLEGAVRAAPAAPASAPSTEPAAPAGHAPSLRAGSSGRRTAPAAQSSGHGRALRIPEAVVDTLAEKVEQLAQGRAHLQHHLRDVDALVVRAREAARASEVLAEDLQATRAGRPHEGSLELVSRLRSLEHELARVAAAGLHEAARLHAPAAIATETLRGLRMQPVAALFEALRRTVREACGRLQRNAEVVLEGGDVRLDRGVLETVREALVHLLRNAIAHGIEAPAERAAAGKPPTGRVTVSFGRRGHRVAIRVTDDGRGLMIDRIVAAAIERGLLSASEGKLLGPEESARLIFRAGVSTSTEVTLSAGRGVGLDAVEAQLTQLGATVQVAWTAGKGTTFDLDVPVLASLTEVVLLRSVGELAALPLEAVERVLRLNAHQLDAADGRGSALVDGHRFPFALLSRLLGSRKGKVPTPGEEPLPVLLLRVAAARIAVGVDELLRSQSVMVQPLPRRLFSAPHVAGAAVLEGGAVVGVLNPVELAARAKPTLEELATRAKKTRLLVTDDALTTRAAMRGVLERGGYEVLTASDGEEAFGLLPDSGIALVVSDVEMPRLDGFGLTRRIREDPRFERLPVILVTSLDDDEYQERGRLAGASGYVIKREVGRGALLAMVRRLLEAAAPR